MPQKPPGHEATLHKRCDEVLHYLWDPIGVAGAPGARDEYESYVPQVVKLLHDGAEEEQIAGYLVRVEGGRMGLSPDHERARQTAEVLLEWRDWLGAEAP